MQGVFGRSSLLSGFIVREHGFIAHGLVDHMIHEVDRNVEAVHASSSLIRLAQVSGGVEYVQVPVGIVVGIFRFFFGVVVNHLFYVVGDASWF